MFYLESSGLQDMGLDIQSLSIHLPVVCRLDTNTAIVLVVINSALLYQQVFWWISYSRPLAWHQSQSPWKQVTQIRANASLLTLENFRITKHEHLFLNNKAMKFLWCSSSGDKGHCLEHMTVIFFFYSIFFQGRGHDSGFCKNKFAFEGTSKQVKRSQKGK